MNPTKTVLVLCSALALLPLPGAFGWFGPGHQLVVKQAVAALPQTMPAFFSEGVATIASCATDPDYFRERTTPQLAQAENSEHYIDLELLQGRALPPLRYEYVKLCQDLNVAPEHVGLLPYAVIEWTQRLTLAFAQHRKWPQDKAIETKCLVYAGLLAHYAADACQPLHCTVHFDGRVDKDGQALAPRGIHAKVDALLERPEVDPAQALADLKVAAFAEVWAAVLSEIARSHALVDKVYDLESKLPAGGERQQKLEVAPELRAFEHERLRAAVAFTASLYLTAWEKSANVIVPEWVQSSP